MEDSFKFDYFSIVLKPLLFILLVWFLYFYYLDWCPINQYYSFDSIYLFLFSIRHFPPLIQLFSYVSFRHCFSHFIDGFEDIFHYISLLILLLFSLTYPLTYLPYLSFVDLICSISFLHYMQFLRSFHFLRILLHFPHVFHSF